MTADIQRRKAGGGRLRLSRPNAVLLDIEGTISDIGFVSRVLFPFVKNNVRRYFEDTFDAPETQELIDRLRESRKPNDDLPRVAPSNAHRSAVIRTVSEFALAQIQQRRRSSEIKQLQILVWVWGYEKGLIKGHLYDEVTTVLHHWKFSHRIKVYIFSSGMIAAQQLLLCHTNHGNCLPLVTDFFDSTIGDKTSPQSYASIVRTIRQPSNKVLFVTDNPKEAKAALEAKLQVCLIQRSSTGAEDSGSTTTVDRNAAGDIPTVTSLEDIEFE